ncbi:MAG: prolipoprotein diacylglyceryl transferase [Chloroflexota bacterium]|nr:prolipoprotein diacylglyceryl transferase [Chloroflexota bacterium]
MKPPVDPILIHITPTFGVYWYGVLIVTGVMLGAVYAAWRAKQDGENPDHVWNALIVAIILGIIGARIYHIFSEPQGGMAGWSYYRQHPIEIFYIRQGGLGIYGAIAGGVLGVLIYARRAKLRPLQWLDYGAPGLALGQAIGRWGNFINQELYGPPTDLPWGLIIDPEYRIAPYNDLTTYPPETLFHPTFLYESLWCLLVFIILALTAHKLKERLLDGDIILGYIIGYPLGRFFIEYFRPDAWMMGPIAAAQLFAILCVVGAVALLVVRHAKAKSVQPYPEPSVNLATEQEIETLTTPPANPTEEE